MHEYETDPISPEQRRLFAEMVVTYGLVNTRNKLSDLGLPQKRIGEFTVDWVLSA